MTPLSHSTKQSCYLRRNTNKTTPTHLINAQTKMNMGNMLKQVITSSKQNKHYCSEWWKQTDSNKSFETQLHIKNKQMNSREPAPAAMVRRNERWGVKTTKRNESSYAFPVQSRFEVDCPRAIEFAGRNRSPWRVGSWRIGRSGLISSGKAWFDVFGML